jgi:hypothetical protein
LVVAVVELAHLVPQAAGAGLVERLLGLLQD